MFIESICRNSSDVSRFLNVVVSSKGVQQKDLAKILHVDPSWLSRSFNGSQNLTLNSFFKLLDFLGIDFTLVYDEDFISLSDDVVPSLNID